MIERFVDKFANAHAAVVESEAVGDTGLGSDAAVVTTNVRPVAVPAARFDIGEIVRHRVFPFRGVVIDVDPEFNNSDEWYESIPEAIRPHKNQPFYHLLAENAESTYVAYVSQQNLVRDEEPTPIAHPAVTQRFDSFSDGRYHLRRERMN